MGAGSFVATPVLRNVGARGLASISAEIASFEDTLFADDATSSKLTGDADKMAVGTFSIHNLGTVLFFLTTASARACTLRAHHR